MGFKKTISPTIDTGKKAKLYLQTYDRAQTIDGVIAGKTSTFPDDFGGWFKENLRLDENGHVKALLEQGVAFKPVQTNTSFLAPSTKRFWHIHPKQNEIWSTSGTILLGLIDFRKGSKTYGVKMKIVLSSDKFVFIPYGVAHGFINPNNTPVVLSYYTDQYFTADDTTQEYRISPKKVSYRFVKSELM